MFRLSRGAEYAIRGMLHLSMQPREEPSAYIEEIARGQDVPKAYLAKIFQTLAKKGFLRSSRGQGGGFRLVKVPEEISVLEVIEAMEGPVHLNDCMIHPGFCERDKTCPMHDLWCEAQKRLYSTLSGTNFAMLAERGVKKLKNAPLTVVKG